MVELKDFNKILQDELKDKTFKKEYYGLKKICFSKRNTTAPER